MIHHLIILRLMNIKCQYLEANKPNHLKQWDYCIGMNSLGRPSTTKTIKLIIHPYLHYFPSDKVKVNIINKFRVECVICRVKSSSQKTYNVYIKPKLYPSIYKFWGGLRIFRLFIVIQSEKMENVAQKRITAFWDWVDLPHPQDGRKAGQDHQKTRMWQGKELKN